MMVLPQSFLYVFSEGIYIWYTDIVLYIICTQSDL